MIAEVLQRRGVVFDVAAFLANMLLAWPLVNLVKRTQGDDPVFAGLLLAAGFLHAAGAYLKRRPLHARLAARKCPEMGAGGYMLFLTLSVMHYAVFTMCIMIGLEGLGLKGLFGAAEPFILLGCALVPTSLAIAVLIPPRVKEEPTPELRARETVADILIYLSTIIILAWWDGFWVEYLAAANRSSMLLSMLLVVLTTVPFAIFYMAPRMALLREDYARAQTWINAAIVMSPLAARLIL